MTKKFKYADYLKKIPTQCPATGASEVSCVAYRWVRNPISKECFLPQAIRNPKRLLSARDAAEACSCWGLSMHDSMKASINAFNHLEKNIPNIRKALGGWVAEGKIIPVHGVCTPPNDFGHFDLHEYYGAAVDSAFAVVTKIP